MRELRSVLPPPAGYTQRRQDSLPSPRSTINRPFTKDDESVNTRSDPYTYTRDSASADSNEHWPQSSNDKSAQLSPITRSPFRPSLPSRGASSPFPMKQNPQLGLGRESNLLNVINTDGAPGKSTWLEMGFSFSENRWSKIITMWMFTAGRVAEDHGQPEDANKRRRL
jgi:hypothetical protein